MKREGEKLQLLVYFGVCQNPLSQIQRLNTFYSICLKQKRESGPEQVLRFGLKETLQTRSGPYFTYYAVFQLVICKNQRGREVALKISHLRLEEY